MKVIFAAFLASLIALPAIARDPKPKPSNVTIHLFGPDLVTQGNPPSSTNGAPAVQPEPTLHEVLHEMFVTGDPQDKVPHFPHPDKAAH